MEPYGGKGPSSSPYFHGRWTDNESGVLNTTIGDPAHQTTWEYLALFVVLIIFGDEFRDTGFAILGDNTSSLGLALNLKGNKALGRISRELSWRRIRQGWRYACGHLPTERNKVADTLSRLSSPVDLPNFPAELKRAVRRSVPKLADL